MKTFKKVLSIIMIAAVVASICVISSVSSGATCTGAGLAEWALNAYNSHWSYVYGGSSPGAVDCSGLIWSYCGGNRTSMLSDAQANGRDWGYVSSGIPRVHGLGLSRPGHVGVYIADGMEVDARGSQYGVCYDAIGGWNTWDCWFKLTAVSYPTTGWEQFNGNSYYYENGEYIVSTTRTIDGVSYTFDASGVARSGGEVAEDVDTSSTDTDTAVQNNTAEDNASDSETAAETEDENAPLKNGSKGFRVEQLQKRLQELGYYTGAIDGDFGTLTEKAFKLFQKTAGLTVDGIAGSDADILYADDAPLFTAGETDEETEGGLLGRRTNDLAETGIEETTDEETADENDADDETADDETADDESEEGALTDSEDSDIAATGADEEDNTEETEAQEEETVEETTFGYSVGDYADEVLLIQERLTTLGYLDGQADGEFGEQTETAVKSFQNVNELVETGIVDEVTYETLFSDDAIKNPEAVKAAKKAAAAKKSAVNTPKKVTTNTAAATPVTAPNTEVEKKTVAVTSKSLSGVTNNVDLQKNAKTTNYQFILWLGIMIVVMLITFAIVFTIEKKKQRAAAQSRRFY